MTTILYDPSSPSSLSDAELALALAGISSKEGLPDDVSSIIYKHLKDPLQLAMIEIAKQTKLHLEYDSDRNEYWLKSHPEKVIIDNYATFEHQGTIATFKVFEDNGRQMIEHRPRDNGRKRITTKIGRAHV